MNATPDGYTLLLVGQPNAINATLYETLPFNFMRDIAPVAGIMTVPNVMVVNPSFPAQTVVEFIAYAKANPDKINMASAGNGSAAHLAGELFKSMTGTSMVHVPYRGQAPAIGDLLSGQVHVLFATSPASMEFIKTGKLKALAVTTAVRADALPDLPTVGDFVPGYEASAWYGIGAPKKTPAEIIDRLNKETNAGLADAKLKVRLADLGGTLIPGSPADFGRLIAEETEKWGKVIRAANIKTLGISAAWTMALRPRSSRHKPSTGDRSSNGQSGLRQFQSCRHDHRPGGIRCRPARPYGACLQLHGLGPCPLGHRGLCRVQLRRSRRPVLPGAGRVKSSA